MKQAPQCHIIMVFGRFITDTRANINEGAAKDERRQKRTGPPQAPTYDMGEEMVKMLNAVTEALRQIDADRQARGEPAYFGPWSSLMSSHVARNDRQHIVQDGMGCWYFVEMYTKLQHNDMLEGFAETLQEVWSHMATFAPARIGYLLAQCYTRDGDRVARQVMGKCLPGANNCSMCGLYHPCTSL